MNRLPTDLENIVYNFQTQLNYNDVIQEYKKKIQPKIKVYMNDNIGVSIHRYYNVKIGGKKSNYWGFFNFKQDIKPLFACDLGDIFYKIDDLKNFEEYYEKIES